MGPPLTIAQLLEQIVYVGRSEPLDWIQSFAETAEIKTAEDIREATHAALRLGQRSGEVTIAEAIRVPRVVAMQGGDEEDCAAFAIALARALGLAYQIACAKGVLYVSVEGVEILPIR